MAEQKTADDATTMEDRIKEVFALLAAPFDPEEVRVRNQGGRDLHYITASTVANRLDDVLGPAGWEFELKPWGDDTLFGTLSIRLPDGSIVRKMNVGGCAGMAEGDNDAKSAASDCLKRCAALVGVGRYLYGCGVPRFVEGVLGINIQDHMPRSNGGGGYQRNGNGGGGYQNSAPRQQSAPPPQRNGNGNGGGGNGGSFEGAPRDGRGLYRWAKGREEAGDPAARDLLKTINGIIKDRFGNLRTVDLSPEQTAEVWGVIAGSANSGGGGNRQPAGQRINRDYDPNQHPNDPADEDDTPF